MRYGSLDTERKHGQALYFFARLPQLRNAMPALVLPPSAAHREAADPPLWFVGGEFGPPDFIVCLMHRVVKHILPKALEKTWTRRAALPVEARTESLRDRTSSRVSPAWDTAS